MEERGAKRRPLFPILIQPFPLFHIVFFSFIFASQYSVSASPKMLSHPAEVGRAGRTLEERNLPLTSAQCLLLLSVFYLFCVWTSSPPPSPPPSPTPSPPHPSAIQGAWGGEGEGEGVKYLQIRIFLDCLPSFFSLSCVHSFTRNRDLGVDDHPQSTCA